MNNTKQRLEKIKSKITSENFLNGRGLGNEISYYIFDYNPKDELIVRQYVSYLVKEINSSCNEYMIKEIDLYKLFLNILRKEDIFEQAILLEKEEGKDYLINAITTFITPEKFIEEIIEDSEKYKVIFITGIGKVYPFIRSHHILNCLQDFISKKPLVLFYPGKYDSQNLVLFNKFKDENYYRAFPLIVD
ncbi:MAG: DUF1788 domain-containing protein [Caloramator sp.]|nr:DUF1788 domain-containing protein [Caloramator sp.]